MKSETILCKILLRIHHVFKPQIEVENRMQTRKYLHIFMLTLPIISSFVGKVLIRHKLNFNMSVICVIHSFQRYQLSQRGEQPCFYSFFSYFKLCRSHCGSIHFIFVESQ